jgi:hypothetical protein
MPLPKVNLDDKPFAEIVREAVARIPAYSSEWTNFNPSDPGITLIELFAWLIESQLYRTNKITDASKINFLKLLGIDSGNESIDKAIIAAQRDFRSITRAVTSTDYEQLVSGMWVSGMLQKTGLTHNPVARVKALPGFHPTQPNPVPGIVSLIIVPTELKPNTELLRSIYLYLDRGDDPTTENPDSMGYRLLTTELFVMGPEYVDVSVKACISILPTFVFDGNGGVRVAVEKSIAQFIDPLVGGLDGKGWPFGRPVYISEIYRVIDDVQGVDFVEIDKEKGLDGRLSNGSAAPKDPEQNVILAPHALARIGSTLEIKQII